MSLNLVINNDAQNALKDKINEFPQPHLKFYYTQLTYHCQEFFPHFLGRESVAVSIDIAIIIGSRKKKLGANKSDT